MQKNSVDASEASSVSSDTPRSSATVSTRINLVEWHIYGVSTFDTTEQAAQTGTRYPGPPKPLVLSIG